MVDNKPAQLEILRREKIQSEKLQLLRVENNIIKVNNHLHEYYYKYK